MIYVVAINIVAKLLMIGHLRTFRYIFLRCMYELCSLRLCDAGPCLLRLVLGTLN